MERHFDEELKSLGKELLMMGSLVEGSIQKSIQALLKRDHKLAEQVVQDDQKVDDMEMKIDEICLRLLALRQPIAVDLRFIAAAMKINTDLERMGDQAVNIAQTALFFIKEPMLKPEVDLPRMAEIAQKMVRDALDALVNRNASLAQSVLQRDDVVDNLYHKNFEEMLALMKQNAQNVTPALHLLLAARNLERIADHATNIAEDVVYLVQGKDIRHHHVEE